MAQLFKITKRGNPPKKFFNTEKIYIFFIILLFFSAGGIPFAMWVRTLNFSLQKSETGDKINTELAQEGVFPSSPIGAPEITDNGNKNDIEPSIIISPTTVLSQQPSLTPVSENLKIQILNGSGVKGQAKIVADLIKQLGFDSVIVGNADDFNYSETIITVNESKNSDNAQKLKKELETGYQVKVIQASPSGSLKYDIVIILGKKV